MAIQTINIGTTANDGTGDPLRTALDKVNDNFTDTTNAASYSVTASATDTSTGENGQPRLMRVGDAGWMTAGKAVTRPTDANSIVVSGCYPLASTASNLPIDEGTRIIHNDWDNTTEVATQIAITVTSARKFFRAKVGNIWSSWQEILHTGNTGSIDPTTSSTDTTSFNHTSTGAVQSMRSAGVQVGSITVTGSATSYNTSSDYRLKEDWQAIENASDRLLSLNPVNFKWKSSEDRSDGFLAHELQAVIPEAVTGEKDEVELIISTDEEGNEIETEVPKHQAIDQSKIVPLLTAALQDALKRIEALESK